jgi:subtilase family serine protease
MFLALAPAISAYAAEPVVLLKGNHPVADLSGFKPAAADRRLDLAIVFALRNRAVLDQFLAAQQDPNSPHYHHWLKPDEFAAQFGPHPSDLQAVAEWLKSEGMTVRAVDVADRLVKFAATVAQAEQLFGVTIIGSADGALYGNTSDPLIPVRFAGVIVRIEGLDNLRAVVPASHSSPSVPGR